MLWPGPEPGADSQPLSAPFAARPGQLVVYLGVRARS